MKAIVIREGKSVKDALKKLDKTSEKVLVVVDGDHRLLGTLSDGDIRRHLLKGRSLDDSINGVYHRNPVVLTRPDASYERAQELMLARKIGLIPVLDEDRKVVELLTWNQVFSKPQKRRWETIDLPVVIMAGGKGTRLEPFTKVFPKPLIPLGDKPIIEVIIDEFREHGLKRFYVTVNYKAEMIEAYFKCLPRDYEITFIRESEYLGTAGALRLLKGCFEGPFIVSNCDTVVKADYAEVVRLHQQQASSITIMSALRHYEIPYGVLSYGHGGEITSLVEKPECTFTINTGCYVLDTEALSLIPDGPCDMPSLISEIIAKNKKAITYPVNESDYVDIGQWDEYRRTVKVFEQVT
ncbi:MAG: CBS domain-containing protein [Proteobacteria bacterium]|nr:CBS domain-containing protein [Pseudomonadota bacterium]